MHTKFLIHLNKAVMFKKWFTFFTICCATTQIHGAEILDEENPPELRPGIVDFLMDNLYISDVSNMRIRRLRINSSSGATYTYRGITLNNSGGLSSSSFINALLSGTPSTDAAQP